MRRRSAPLEGDEPRELAMEMHSVRRSGEPCDRKRRAMTYQSIVDEIADAMEMCKGHSWFLWQWTPRSEMERRWCMRCGAAQERPRGKEGWAVVR